VSLLHHRRRMSGVTGAITRMLRRTNLVNPANAIRNGFTNLDNEFKEEYQHKLVADFADKASFLKWRVSTDAEIRGKSVANISWDEESKTGIFEGVLDQTVDPSVRDHVKKSGFAAIRSPPIDTPVDLLKYDCLEVRAKGDGKVYVLNLLPLDRYMAEEWRLFQAPLITKPHVWHTTLIPFSDFLSSYRGMIDAEPFKYSGQPLVGLGFLMAQRVAGPFRLELDWIQAVSLKEKKAAARYDPNYV